MSCEPILRSVPDGRREQWKLEISVTAAGNGLFSFLGRWTAGLDGQAPPMWWKQSQRSLQRSVGLCIGTHLAKGVIAVIWMGKERFLCFWSARTHARNLGFSGREKERSVACYCDFFLCLRLSLCKMWEACLGCGIGIDGVWEE